MSEKSAADVLAEASKDTWFDDTQDTGDILGDSRGANYLHDDAIKVAEVIIKLIGAHEIEETVRPIVRSTHVYDEDGDAHHSGEGLIIEAVVRTPLIPVGVLRDILHNQDKDEKYIETLDPEVRQHLDDIEHGDPKYGQLIRQQEIFYPRRSKLLPLALGKKALAMDAPRPLVNSWLTIRYYEESPFGQFVLQQYGSNIPTAQGMRFMHPDEPWLAAFRQNLHDLAVGAQNQLSTGLV